MKARIVSHACSRAVIDLFFSERVDRKISFCKLLMFTCVNIYWPVFLSPLSAAEWSQALLYRVKTEPLHHQEHEGHLPRFHREAGQYRPLVITWVLLLLHITLGLLESCREISVFSTNAHYSSFLISENLSATMRKERFLKFIISITYM